MVSGDHMVIQETPRIVPFPNSVHPDVPPMQRSASLFRHSDSLKSRYLIGRALHVNTFRLWVFQRLDNQSCDDGSLIHRA